MKKIIFLYWEVCPYCTRAKKVMKELVAENPSYGEVKIEKIETRFKREKAAAYPRTYVPCIYIENEKIYEAHPGETYEECRNGIQKAFESAIM